jgi:glutamate dehydrogenase
MARTWLEQLSDSLVKKIGQKNGHKLWQKYRNAFNRSYLDECDVKRALNDILLIEKLTPEKPFEIDFYVPVDAPKNILHLRLIQLNHAIPLSDVLPMLENMGLRTVSERPYKVQLAELAAYLSDFTVEYISQSAQDIEAVEGIFQDAFINIWFGRCESDGFNQLVLGAGLSWRQIIILRAYAKYMHQIGFRFSQNYIEKIVANYAGIARDLVAIFELKFNPKLKSDKKKMLLGLEKNILAALEAITNLDEDRIMRRFLQLITATLRTNYFQFTHDKPKEYLAFKMQSSAVPDLPLPRPLYEIFVYAPRFEAIHLRAEKVARGGIRWSDRREDFRTEVLGLMKAQKVKNAVIVPSGAKGGFVLKSLVPMATRDALQAEVIYCYKEFMRGLLDLTDNLVKGKVAHPQNVVCYDDDDPYLVVAADKGTATFSDTANAIAKEYGFWLGDAFASGGSAGYDHKKIGITARGAWESIRRHFRELNINIDETDITVIGVGDMSGDVFGNGMIYTPHIKLIAAFDHRNIFIDPNPHPEKSYRERLRLFELPMSSWEDYNPKLISKGGGVFKRSSKSISLSAEIKQCLAIEDNALTPNELIRAILQAPVDLFFNGGIGTYVKAIIESQADVGDKTNEFCRINGGELRCRVVGEGGNLGFTQLGRIEYALKGGLINTDFIDNSAGVDCSDHEVNIKILLSKAIIDGKLTEKKRNALLASMTEEVAQLVLRDNYSQALAMSFSAVRTTHYTGLYQTYLNDLEAQEIVDRAVEFLPDDKEILQRKAAQQGLTRPEVAVLLAYTKINTKKEILKSDLPEDSYFSKEIELEFPKILRKEYSKYMQVHSLRREIIATQLSNQIVNEMGITFIYRISVETGATIAEIIKAHAISSRIFEANKLEKFIESFGFKITVELQYELLHYVRMLLNLSTRWFLRSRYMKDDIAKTIEHFGSRIKKVQAIIPQLMVGSTKEFLDKLAKHFIESGLGKKDAHDIAVYRALYISLNIIDVATLYKFDLIQTTRVYFEVGAKFNLVWFRDQIATDSREGHWNSLARLTLRDELDALQRLLTVVILRSDKKQKDHLKLINTWRIKHCRAVRRWEKILELLHGSATVDYTMFFIALRELSDWVNTSQMIDGVCKE